MAINADDETRPNTNLLPDFIGKITRCSTLIKSDTLEKTLHLRVFLRENLRSLVFSLRKVNDRNSIARRLHVKNRVRTLTEIH